MPVIFLGWLAFALAGLPFIVVRLGIQEGIGDLLVSGVILLPVCWVVATRGSARSTQNRLEKIIFFAVGAVLTFGLSVACLVAGGEVGAVTFLYVGLFFASVCLAIVRSGDAPAARRRMG